ncbi:hypothetical protein BO70DRAFT_416808 [Aspergillus heteromorphus CBS 117.55]|uniref:Thioesterase domain-containing protein n=1 Tax=Aspergillus heteromorphus CBS 117.55 TaxID=1448321 RepID=A0A317V973_9EURO|nr:uncharacterized protein BO70DRAFT_416808 [Aspergillus heteromorphus CBS 117.55]PWY69588.1 hypothetical protein BO70DRAFT_416808 [Aspergillus heteromorphus CBS 117.55]
MADVFPQGSGTSRLSYYLRGTTDNYYATPLLHHHHHHISSHLTSQFNSAPPPPPPHPHPSLSPHLNGLLHPRHPHPPSLHPFLSSAVLRPSSTIPTTSHPHLLAHPQAFHRGGRLLRQLARHRLYHPTRPHLATPCSSPIPSARPPPCLARPTDSPTPIHAPDLILILQLATPGISGHPSTVHGGVIATALDEAMSYAVALYAPETGPRLTNADPDDIPPTTTRGKLYTAQLDIRYKSPANVPGYLVIRVKVLARVGRKFWVRAQAFQPEEEGPGREGRMRLTTDAIAFWMQTGPSL